MGSNGADELSEMVQYHKPLTREDLDDLYICIGEDDGTDDACYSLGYYRYTTLTVRLMKH